MFLKSKQTIIASVIILTVVGTWIHNNIVEFHTSNMQNKAFDRINLYQNSLHNELTRFNFLPFTIARDKQLIDLAFKQDLKANLMLEDIKKESGANEVYIMDSSGITLSASNWNDKNSFVNKNFNFRPYFKQAMSGENGQFFGIGTTSKKPGFYISTGIKNKNKIIGVAVAKVDLSVLENIWTKAGENIFITNNDGVVILSSKPKWKYQSLNFLDELQLKNIKNKQQFSGKNLNILSNNEKTKKGWLNIDNNDYIHQQQTLSSNWRIHYLTQKQKINQLILRTWTKIGLGLLVIFSLILLWYLLNSHGKLKISLQESAKLKQLNHLLTNEIKQRKKIENDLIIAKQNIEKNTKLATIGQLSTSIIHEISQPLSAMKTYIASAMLPKQAEKLTKQEYIVLPKLDMLVDRINKISQQLRYFASNDNKEITKTNIKDVLDSTLVVVSPMLKQEKITLISNIKDNKYYANINKLRLEQVLINLINNAKDALKNSKKKQITIKVKNDDKNLIITIKDTGSGIDEKSIKMLFDAFWTTKASGVGLGLGLTISNNIINEFGGTLNAKNNTDCGSSFIITLPI